MLKVRNLTIILDFLKIYAQVAGKLFDISKHLVGDISIGEKVEGENMHVS